MTPAKRLTRTAGIVMSLELKNVVKRVGADIHIHETNLTLPRGRFNILLGTTLAGKTTLMQLMAGLERPTSGEMFVPRQERHRRAGAEAQRRDGLPAVHQLPEFHRLREHRLAAAGGRHARRRDRRTASSARPNCCSWRPMLDRTPTELSGGQQQRTAHRPRPRQGCRPRPARRAARQPRLQAARGAARRTAEALRRPATASSSMPPPSRPRRCCSAATPRRCTKAGSRSSARPRRSIAGRRPDHRPGLLRSADQHRAVIKQGGEILIGDSDPPARRQVGAAIRRRLVRSGHPPASHHRACAASAHRAPIEGRVLVTEITGSESVVHFDLNGRTWVSQSHGIHPSRSGAPHASMSMSTQQLLLRRRRSAHRGRQRLGERSPLDRTSGTAYGIHGRGAVRTGR